MNENTITSRAEQKLLTRQKLLEATIDIIAEEGLAGVTMAKVAERTGLSRGICNFHFETKEQLMLDAFRVLYQEQEQAWRKVTGDTTLTAEERIVLLVKTLLTPPLADHRKVAVWLAFWGVTPHRQTYLDLCTESDCQYEEAIEHLLLELSGGSDTVNGMSLRALSVALTGMIDGTHLQYLIAPDRLSPDEAIQACLAFLRSFFPTLP